MSSQIAVVQQNLKAIAEQLCASEKRDLRLAAVEYKDHCDPTVVSQQDFTESVGKTNRYIDTWSATGGGDHPECIACGLHAASKLDWRSDATKMLLLCADAPPHGVGSGGDNHPNGCPLGLDPLKITRTLVEKEVVIYTVGVNNPDRQTVSFLCTVSKLTGGRYLPLAAAANLPKIFLGGAEEELELAKFEKAMEDEEKFVLEQAKQNSEVLDDAEVTKRVAARLAEKDIRVKKLNVESHGGGEKWQAREERLAKASSLSSYAAVEAADDYCDAPGYSGAGDDAMHSFSAYAELDEDCDSMSVPAPAPARGGGGIFSTVASYFRPAPAPASSPSYSGSRPMAKAQAVEQVEDVISVEQVSRFRTKKAK